MTQKVSSNMRTLAAGEVDATALATNAVTGTKIAATAVNGSKIGMGSDARGDILFRDNTQYARLAAGTAGQALLTGGAGANPAYGYRGWHPIQRISGATDYEFTGFTASTFCKVLVKGWARPVSDDKDFWLRTCPDEFVSAADEGVSDYAYVSGGGMLGTGSAQDRFDAANSEIVLGGHTSAGLSVGAAATELIEFEFSMSMGFETAAHKLIKGSSVWIDPSGRPNCIGAVCGIRLATAAVQGFELTFEDVAPADGDVTLYGLVNA